MVHEWHYSIKGKNGENTVKGTAKFSDEEWGIFQRYDDYAGELSETSLVREGGPGQLKVDWVKEKGFTFKVKLPPDDLVIALLHRIRPFVLKNEPSNFNRVCNYIGRHTDSDSLRQFLDIQKDAYSGENMRKQVQIVSNDVVINSDETLHKWLNAFEYHRDADKRAEIDALHRLIPLEASRAIFVMMLYDKVRAILNVRGLIRTILGKQTAFKTYPS